MRWIHAFCTVQQCEKDVVRVSCGGCSRKNVHILEGSATYFGLSRTKNIMTELSFHGTLSLFKTKGE